MRERSSPARLLLHQECSNVLRKNMPLEAYLEGYPDGL